MSALSMSVIAAFSSLTVLHTLLTRRRLSRATRTAISSLPKVELHVHLDGSFSPALMSELLVSKFLRDPEMKFAPERVRLPWIEEGRAGDHLYVRDNLVAAASSILGISSSSPSSSSPSSPPPPPPHPSSYPPAAVASFQSMCTCGGYRSLFVMLEKFFTFTPLIAGDLPAIQRSADEFVSRQKESNVAYTEVRFSPHLLCCADPENPSNAVLTPTEVTDAVIRGIRAGCARERIHVNIILCCIAWRPEWAGSIVDLAAHYRASQNARFDPSTMSWSSHVRRCSVFSDFYTGNVVGVDIAAGEEHFFKDTHPHLHGPHVEAMQKAHEQGIKITMHAGEVTTGEQVEEAINVYHASRIGHGYRAVENGGRTLEYCRSKNVHIEVCPTSSYETGGWSGVHSEKSNWRRHPLLKMVGCQPCEENGGGGGVGNVVSGVSVGLNSDDPEVFCTDLNREFLIAHRDIGLPLERLKRSVSDALEAAFLDCAGGDKLKAHLKGIIA